MADHQPIRRDPITEGQRAILSLRRQLEGAQFRADRMMGRAPQIVLGERVRVRPEARWSGLADEEFMIIKIVGRNEDAMVMLRAPDARVIKWFRAPELLPANEVTTMFKNASTELLQLTSLIEKERRLDFRGALLEASRQRPDLAEAYISGDDTAMVTPQQRPVADVTEDTLMVLANQIAREQHISLSDAVKLAASRNPTAVKQYNENFNCGTRADR